MGSGGGGGDGRKCGVDGGDGGGGVEAPDGGVGLGIGDGGGGTAAVGERAAGSRSNPRRSSVSSSSPSSPNAPPPPPPPAAAAETSRVRGEASREAIAYGPGADFDEEIMPPSPSDTADGASPPIASDSSSRRALLVRMGFVRARLEAGGTGGEDGSGMRPDAESLWREVEELAKSGAAGAGGREWTSSVPKYRRGRG